MALVPDARRCDRCKKYDARPMIIGHRVDENDAEVVVVTKKDLCAKCVELLDNAILRAVQAKK